MCSGVFLEAPLTAQKHKQGLCGQVSLKLFSLLHVAAVYWRKRLGACPHYLSGLKWKRGNAAEFPFSQVTYDKRLL